MAEDKNYLVEIGSYLKVKLLVPATAERRFMRNNNIGFKVTEQENNLIQQKADRAKTSISAYVRSCALNKPIVVVEGLRELLPELSRIGNNLNQLTIILRQNNIRNPDFNNLKQEYTKFFEKAKEVLEHGNHQNG